MDINQIKKYLPAGWDVVDLIDHGIIDLDIMNGKMMGEYVAVLMIKSYDKITESHISRSMIRIWVDYGDWYRTL